MFNIQEAVRKVKAGTSHLTGLKIAVMGCIVNGPGEMADADYGYVGAGPGKVHIYKGKTPILKNINEDDAIEQLLKLIQHATLTPHTSHLLNNSTTASRSEADNLTTNSLPCPSKSKE